MFPSCLRLLISQFSLVFSDEVGARGRLNLTSTQDVSSALKAASHPGFSPVKFPQLPLPVPTLNEAAGGVSDAREIIEASRSAGKVILYKFCFVSLFLLHLLQVQEIITLDDSKESILHLSRDTERANRMYRGAAGHGHSHSVWSRLGQFPEQRVVDVSVHEEDELVPDDDEISVEYFRYREAS